MKLLSLDNTVPCITFLKGNTFYTLLTLFNDETISDLTALNKMQTLHELNT